MTHSLFVKKVTVFSVGSIIEDTRHNFVWRIFPHPGSEIGDGQHFLLIQFPCRPSIDHFTHENQDHNEHDNTDENECPLEDNDWHWLIVDLLSGSMQAGGSRLPRSISRWRPQRVCHVILMMSWLLNQSQTSFGLASTSFSSSASSISSIVRHSRIWSAQHWCRRGQSPGSWDYVAFNIRRPHSSATSVKQLSFLSLITHVNSKGNKMVALIFFLSTIIVLFFLHTERGFMMTKKVFCSLRIFL